MNKKSVLRVISAIMSVAVTLSLVAFDSFASENEDISSSWKDKIDPVVIDKMDNTTNAIPVWLWFHDIDHNAVRDIVYEKTGLTEDNLSVNNEPLPESLSKMLYDVNTDKEVFRKEFADYLERTAKDRELEKVRTDNYIFELRSTTDELLRENNSRIFDSLGLSKEKIISSELGAPTYLMNMTGDEIERAAKNDEVEAIYFYDNSELMDYSLSDEVINNLYPTSIEASTVSALHDYFGLDGTGVKIGIIDSGLISTDTEIPQSRVSTIAPNVSSHSDHTTTVAKIAAGSYGVAPDAHVYVSSNNTASEFVTSTITAIQNQTNATNNIGVINLSKGKYGDGTNWYTSFDIYVDYLCKERRVCLVCAVGNKAGDTTLQGRIGSPAMAYNTIGVGGYFNQGTSSFSDDVMYPQSSYNNGNGCLKPDFVANQSYVLYGSLPDTGTSFAAPLVTGVIALLFEYRPSLKAQPEAVKAILMASCYRKVTQTGYPSESIFDGLTEHQGAGAIDPYRALAIVLNNDYGYATMSSSGTQAIVNFSQHVYNASGLNVSLAWAEHNVTTTVDGPRTNLNFTLKRNNAVIGTSSNSNSSTEMVFVEGPSTVTNYQMVINRACDQGFEIKYAYAYQ